MALLACLAVGISRRAGSSARVTAFSVATLTTSTRAASAIGASVPCSTGSFQAFFRRNFRTSSSSPSTITALQQSAVADAAVELEKTMDVTHPAFDVIAKDVVSEYGAYTTLYRHKKSGAELLSVASDDDNKVFGITFRTPPSDSTGVPHILEHSVLCGSKKYTTKDPFVQLLQGSLQTFLNAFTYPDRTCYVVSQMGGLKSN